MPPAARATVSAKERKDARLLTTPDDFFVTPLMWRLTDDGNSYEELKYADLTRYLEWRNKSKMVPTGKSCTPAAMVKQYRNKPQPLFGIGAAATLPPPQAFISDPQPAMPSRLHQVCCKSDATLGAYFSLIKTPSLMLHLV